MDIGKIGVTTSNQNMDNIKNKTSDDDFAKKLKKAFDNKDEEALKKVCNEFEGIFLQMMYKQMKATVPKSELISEAAGRDIFESMMDEKLMDEASKTNSFGLANQMYKQLSRQMNAKYIVDSEGDTNKIDEKK